MNPKMGRKSLQHQVHSIPKWKNATYRDSQIDLLFLSTFLSNQNPPTNKKKPLYMHIFFSFIHSVSLSYVEGMSFNSCLWILEVSLELIQLPQSFSSAGAACMIPQTFSMVHLLQASNPHLCPHKLVHTPLHLQGP